MADPRSFASFRKPPAPAPAAKSAVDWPVYSAAALPGTGKLPLPAGSKVRLLPEEARQLKQLGWKEGEPIPGGLADVLDTIVQEQLASTRDLAGLLPVPADTPPVTARTIEIEALPADKQAEILALTRQMIEREKQKAASPALAMAPGVQQAIALGEAGAAPEVTANLAQPTGAWSAGPARGAEFHTGKVNLQQLAQQVAAERAARNEAGPTVMPTPEPAPEPVAHADAGATLAICPHCGWDQTRPDDIEPTTIDKQWFLAMVLSTGADDIRFRKDVPLFGGAVVVTFRTLTVTEEGLAWEQVGFDRLAHRYLNAADQMRAFQHYRLVLTLESVTRSGSGLIRVADHTTESPDDRETILPSVVAWLKGVVLPHENLLRAVEHAFLQFQRLAAKLEENHQNADFWAGIGAQP